MPISEKIVARIYFEKRLEIDGVDAMSKEIFVRDVELLDFDIEKFLQKIKEIILLCIQDKFSFLER